MSLIRMTQIFKMERSTKTIMPNMTFKTRRKKGLIFASKKKWVLCYVVFIVVFFQLVMCSLVSGSPETTLNSAEVLLPTVSTLPPSLPRKSLSQKSREILKPHQRPGAVSKPTGPVRDLRIVPISVRGRDTLQLNVTWLPPKGVRQPEGYSIVVRAFDMKGCETIPCHYDTMNPKASHLIPAFMSTIDGEECSIRPGCSYNMSLTTYPSSRNNPTTVTTNISIPECVDHLCSCRGPSRLLAPSINATAFSNNSIYVVWGYNSSVAVDISIIQYYKLFFRIPSVVSSHPLPWAVLDQEFDIPSENKTFFSLVIKRNITPGLNYKVMVHAVNAKNCEGPVAAVSVSLSDEPNVDKRQHKTKMYSLELWALCAIVVLGFLVVFLIMRFRPRCHIKQVLQRRATSARTGGTAALHQQTAWPPPYLRGNDLSFGNDQRHFEESPLYVDKEIIEAQHLGFADSWEVSPKRITLGTEIGEGAFGRVFMAKVDLPGHHLVAVKTLKSKAAPDEVEEFLEEISMLKLVGRHPNVVALVGCCTLNQPYWVLLEYAPGGDLQHHLKALRDAWKREMNTVTSRCSMSSSYVQTPGMQAECRDRPSVAETEYTMLGSDATTRDIRNSSGGPLALRSGNTGSSIGSDAFADSSESEPGHTPLAPNFFTPARNPTVGLVLDSNTLHNYALQIARGMEHLEKKGITHRDLAARNVLIDAHGGLKVSDLGLSRPGVYVTKRQKKKVPLRWMALEAILNNGYTNKSDVWSYAVVLWEIGTLGGFPYQTLRDGQVQQFLMEGNRLSKPEAVSQELYSTMLSCWEQDPDLRPSFADLVTILDGEKEHKAYVDISMLHSNYVFPPTEETATLKIKNEAKNNFEDVKFFNSDAKIV